MLEVEGRVHSTWQEAAEREVMVRDIDVAAAAVAPTKQAFAWAPSATLESLQTTAGHVVGQVVRHQEAIAAEIEITATRLDGDLYRVRATIENRSENTSPAGDETASAARDMSLARSMVSTHAVLELAGGEFISLLEPPDDCRQLAAECQNIGAWPVMAGDSAKRDTMLASPIILYDYPQIAPESGGDFCDGAEIDEMLALRIMTLTDEEKRQMRDVDDRARAILERTELMPSEQFHKLHGAIRGLRPASESTS